MNKAGPVSRLAGWPHEQGRPGLATGRP